MILAITLGYCTKNRLFIAGIAINAGLLSKSRWKGAFLEMRLQIEPRQFDRLLFLILRFQKNTVTVNYASGRKPADLTLWSGRARRHQTDSNWEFEYLLPDRVVWQRISNIEFI